MDPYLFFNNNRYLSSKEAGKIGRLTHDYISRLCRRGILEGRKVGGAWYVEENSLYDFLIERAQTERERKQELAEQRKQEYGERADEENLAEQNSDSVELASTGVPSSSILFLGITKTKTFALFATFLLVLSWFAVYANADRAGEYIAVVADSFEKGKLFVEEKAGEAFSSVDVQTDAALGIAEAQVLGAQAVSNTFGYVADLLGRVSSYVTGIFVQDEAQEPVASDTATTTETFEVAQGTTTRQLPLAADRTLDINSNVQVTQGFTVSGGANIGAGTSVGGGLTVSGAGQFSSLLNVLGGATVGGGLQVQSGIIANGGIVTNGADVDLGVGEIFASNIVNGIRAGTNVTITGDDSNPTISVLESGVRRINGRTGAVTLEEGTDISIDGLQIANISTLSSVRTRGGCSGCIVDADVIDALTISGGTIDDTPIGATTPSTGVFSSIGIGTSTPAKKLGVNGDVFLGALTATSTLSVQSTATSTFQGGLSINASGSTSGLKLSIDCSALANGGTLTTDSSGFVVCAVDDGGAGGVSDYTDLGDTPSAHTANAVIFTNSAGTALTADATFAYDGTNFGIGSTSPFAKLSVHGRDGETNTTLFAVASSTVSATSTLFSISNMGVLTSNASATSTFTGGLATAGLTTSQGLFITGQGLHLSSGATSTLNNGIALSDGCFQLPDGTCLENAGASITAIGPTGQTADGPTVTLATSTDNATGLTSALTIIGSGDTLTYTPTLTGTLNPGFGGTGQDFSSASGVITAEGGTFSASSTLALNRGGTGLSSYTAGDLIYADATADLTQLNIGTNGFILAAVDGLPGWVSTSTFIIQSEIDTFSELDAIVADKSLANLDDAQTFASLITFSAGLLSQASSTVVGDFTVGGTGSTLTVEGTATSTFTGGLATAGLTTSQGLFITGQGLHLSSSATSTFDNGLDISAGCFAVGGTCLDTNASGVVSSGTAGQTAYFETDGTTVTGTSTLFLASNQQVGIGTTTPNNKLTIFNDAADSALEFSSASGDVYKWTIGQDFSDAGKFKIASSSELGSSDRLVIDGAGNVGVGTSSPAARFGIVGGIFAQGGATTTGSLEIQGTATSTFSGGLSVNTSGSASGIKLPTNVCSGFAGGGSLTTDSNGYIICDDDQGGAGGGITLFTELSDTHDTHVPQAVIFTNSAGTALTADATFAYDGTNFGIGSTSPFAKLSVHGRDGETNTTLFAVASSTVSATSTLFSISNTGVLTSSAAATSTFTGPLSINTSGSSSGLLLSVDCTAFAGGGTLTTDSNGYIVCDDDQGGAGDGLSLGGSEGQIQYHDGSDLGGTSVFLFDDIGLRFTLGTTTLQTLDTVLTVSATSSDSDNILDVNNENGVNLFRITHSGDIGLSSTTPAARLGVNGDVFLGALTATSTLTVQSAASSTFSGGLFTAGLSSSAGLFVTGGGLHVSSGATSTANNGFNISDGCFAIDGTCVETGITAIGPTGQTADGPTVTLATSTDNATGLTSALTIIGSGDTLTYTPTLTGTLNPGFGGTGQDFSSASGVITAEGGTFSASSTLALNRGGTGLSSYTAGDLIYADATADLTQLNIGTNGFILAVVDGLPGWVSTSTFIIQSEIDTFSELDAIVADKSLANLDDAQTFVSLITFSAGLLSQASSTVVGDFTVGGTGSTLTVEGTATSTFTGGLATAGLTTSQGLFITGQGLHLSSSATSTFDNGLDISAGCFAVGGTCLDTNASGVVSSGTAGQTAYFETDGTTVTGTSTLFLASNQQVGIGTTTPNNKLTIFNDAADSALEFSSASGDVYKWTIGQDFSDAGKFKIASSSELGSSDRLVIDGAGNVGVGTSSPWGNLSVTGSGLVPGLVVSAQSGDLIFTQDGKLGVGTSTPAGQLGVADLLYVGGTGTSTFQENLAIFGGLQVGSNSLYLDSDSIDNTGGGILVLNESGGNVGVGTTSPGGTLGVAGSIFSTGTTTSAGLKITASGIEFSDGTIQTSAPSGGTPGGSDGQLQYNNGGSFGGTTGLVWDDTNSFLGVGTTSPATRFAVGNGDVWLDSTRITFASSSAAELTLDFRASATSTIIDGESYAFTIATSTLGDAIFRIDTGAGNYATTSITGGFDVNSGAIHYDAGANQTAIERLNLGPVSFEDDAGWVSWINLPVTSSSASGDVQAFSAQIDALDLLTVYSQADGNGGITKTRVVVGTSTASVLGSTNIPYGSLIVADGIICVDDGGGENCDDAQRFAGGLYATSSTVTAIDLAENYPTKDATLGSGEIVMLDPQNPVFVARYDAATSSRRHLLGVVSTAPGVLLGGFGSNEYSDEHQVAVTLSGRVPVKVNLEGGPIAPGDRIAPSSVPGVGMKATTTGRTIGVALTGYSVASTTKDTVIAFIENEMTFADSEFYVDPQTGNVGIGTTSPSEKLSVGGNVAAQSFIAYSGAATSTFAGGIDIGSGGLVFNPLSGHFGIGTALSLSGANLDIAGAVSGSRFVDTGDISYFIDPANASTSALFAGNVGIGTTAPSEKLTVHGGVLATGTTTLASLNGGVNIGTTTSSALLTIAGRSATSTENLISVLTGSSTNALTITSDGKVGIGTTTPQYDLHVIGNVAAQSFVNISTQGEKEDIEHLSASDVDNLMDTVRGIKLARYNYRDDQSHGGLGTTTQQYFGLIAEEAPSEVLSVDGRGVDLYKLTSLSIAGIQNIDERLQNVESLLGEIGSSTATSTGNGGGLFVLFLDYLSRLGVRIAEGIVQVTDLIVADHITVGENGKPSGITLFDEYTGEPYCLRISKGMPEAEKGRCEDVTFDTPTGVLEGAYSSNTAEDSTVGTSTPETDTNTGTTTPPASQAQEETGTSTPPVSEEENPAPQETETIEEESVEEESQVDTEEEQVTETEPTQEEENEPAAQEETDLTSEEEST